jgi:hypothetical protein
VKQDFSHLPPLKRLALERFLFPLYEQHPIAPHITERTKVCLFTWVLSDGWGDLIAAKEALVLLKERFPEIEFNWVALVPNQLQSANVDAAYIYYDKECPISLLTPDVLKTLRSSDLILSLPTFYPHTEALMKTVQDIPSVAPLPRLICIGQYGYLESSWFHPKSGHRSMGLHLLEKGILIRKSMNPNFSQIENKELLLSLFGMAAPGPFEIENYLNTHQFYLAYLLSPVGGAVYLHALLKSHVRDVLPIDICTPDLGWFVGHIERQKKAGKPILEGNFRVKTIDVHYEGKVYATRLADEGKKVRILCPGAISDADFRLLVRLSGEFVGVRGDQSFSEVVSANRAFFYDGALHARYFVKDLLALAENRLAPHRSALTIFRGMGKAYLHILPDDENEWVDETHFQEKEPWVMIAHSIGNALQDPDALAGFKKFNRIIADEHSFNSFLSQLVAREITHRASDSIAQFEGRHASLFANQQCTLVQLMAAMRGLLLH